jgi:cytochrome P450
VRFPKGLHFPNHRHLGHEITYVMEGPSTAGLGRTQPPALNVWETLDRLRRFRRDSLGVVQQMYERHGPVVFENTRPLRGVHLFGPDATRLVLQDRDGIFSARRSWTLIMGRIFPNGLMLRDGEDHLHHRRIMQGAFTRTALRGYLEQMNPQIADTLATWPSGKQMLAFRAYKTLTLELACNVFLGLGLGRETARVNHAFEHAVAAAMSILRLPIPGLTFDRGLRGRRYLEQLFGSMLRDKRAAQTDDMFSRLCHAQDEDGERLSDQEIIDHMIFLMMAAHDTTTSTLTSMTYELARHPEWQERARAESLALGKARLDFDDMLELRSLNLVLQETLRRYPPLSTIPRVSTAPFEFDGYTIPASTLVVIYPIHTHHMSELWTDPFHFDPDRFAPPREEHKRHSHAWVPFSGGAHTCLGLRFAEMQVRAVMHQLLQRYRIRVADGYQMPVQQAPISKPLDGLPIFLDPL